jgi:hypothetical protein
MIDKMAFFKKNFFLLFSEETENLETTKKINFTIFKYCLAHCEKKTICVDDYYDCSGDCKIMYMEKCGLKKK